MLRGSGLCACGSVGDLPGARARLCLVLGEQGEASAGRIHPPIHAGRQAPQATLALRAVRFRPGHPRSGAPSTSGSTKLLSTKCSSFSLQEGRRCTARLQRGVRTTSQSPLRALAPVSVLPAPTPSPVTSPPPVASPSPVASPPPAAPLAGLRGAVRGRPARQGKGRGRGTERRLCHVRRSPRRRVRPEAHPPDPAPVLPRPPVRLGADVAERP